MNHVSGHPDYYPLDFVDRRMLKPIDPDELIRRYAGAPLDFEPGTRWSYSNTGFVLLGRILEKAGGQPLGSFMREKIFRAARHDPRDLRPEGRRPSRGTGLHLVRLDEAHARGSERAMGGSAPRAPSTPRQPTSFAGTWR